jgi:hypothetical protein
MKIVTFIFNKIVARGCAYTASLIVVIFLPNLIGIKRWWHIFPFSSSPVITVSEEVYYIVSFLIVAIIGFIIQETIQLILSKIFSSVTLLCVEK